MTISANAIIRTIDQLLDGKIGTTRVIAATTMEPGHWPWLGQMLSKPRYDIVLESLGQHEASPCSARANYRLAEMRVLIEMHHKLPAVVQESKRDTVRGTALLHADTMMQALCFPGNLTQTSAASATGIVSGMLIPNSVDRDIVSEEWTGDNRGLVTAITGRMIVKISQAI